MMNELAAQLVMHFIQKQVTQSFITINGRCGRLDLWLENGAIGLGYAGESHPCTWTDHRSICSNKLLTIFYSGW